MVCKVTSGIEILLLNTEWKCKDDTVAKTENWWTKSPWLRILRIPNTKFPPKSTPERSKKIIEMKIIRLCFKNEIPAILLCFLFCNVIFLSVSEITKGNFTFQNDVITYIFKYVSFTLKSIDHKKLIEKFINSNYLIESQFWKEKYYIAETKKKNNSTVITYYTKNWNI